jgi:pyruvate ferredoxin oxidoreductase alpha subunit
VGSLSICSFRPFPLAEVQAALHRANRVVILEKCLAVGVGGIVSDGVRKALSGIAIHTHTVIAGLGGRAITRQSLMDMIGRAAAGELSTLNFLDLRWDVVKRELEREKGQRRAGPTATNILRDLGAVGARIG